MDDDETVRDRMDQLQRENSRMITDLIDGLETLPGHPRDLLGADLCDRLLAALDKPRPPAPEPYSRLEYQRREVLFLAREVVSRRGTDLLESGLDQLGAAIVSLDELAEQHRAEREVVR